MDQARGLWRIAAAVWVIGVLVTTSAGAVQNGSAPANVLALMEEIVAPESDAIFEIVDPPRDPAQWAAARGHAAKLLSVGPLMLVAGVAKDNDEWVTQVHAYDAAAANLVKAADVKNFDAFLAASDAAAESCVNCHKRYLAR